MRAASALLVLLLAVAPRPAVGAEEVNRIVLRVNDHIVTLVDYLARRNARVEAIAAAPELALEQRRQLIAEAGRATLQELFEEALVLSRAKQLKLEPSPGEIDRALDGMRRRFGIQSDEEFARALAQTGATLADMRRRAARNLLFSKVVQQEVQPRIKVETRTPRAIGGSTPTR
jgi:hypothetical protein